MAPTAASIAAAARAPAARWATALTGAVAAGAAASALDGWAAGGAAAAAVLVTVAAAERLADATRARAAAEAEPDRAEAAPPVAEAVFAPEPPPEHPTPAAPPDEPAPRLPGPDEGLGDRLRAALASLPRMAEILIAHARHVVEDTDRASRRFMEELGSIDGQIRELTAFVASSRTDLDVAATARSQEAAEDGAVIDRIEGAFAENAALVARIIAEREAFLATVVTMRRLDGELQSIRDLSRDIKLLALNAGIQAARASADGAGFGVIAREIRGLSEQTDRTARALSPLVAEARRAVEAFAEDRSVERRLRDQVAVLDVTRDRLAGVSRRYAALVDHERALADQTEDRGRRIERAICDALATVQFQDIVRQQLEAVVAGLAELGESAEKAIGAASAGAADGEIDAGAVDEALERLRQGYVMNRQRDAHALASGDATPAPAAPAIELF